MPIEKRPHQLVPKGPRPGSRIKPHQVRDNETLETVARQYGVPVRQLILHNFGTEDPAEINWYLREYVGCTLPTHDRKNWRFSSAANPGLIYIPDNAIRMPAIEVKGQPPKPVDLDLPGPPTFLASEKFVLEFKVPPKDPAELGYFLLQAKINVEGELKQPHGFVKTSLKKGQVKAAVEAKFTDKLKGTLTMKFDEKSLKPIADAVAGGSKQGLVKALASPFEVSLKRAFPWGPVTLVPELGLEVSTTPVILRVAGEFEDSLVVEGSPYTGKFAVKIGCNIGLSAKGWEWVAEKVGRPVLKAFLEQGGRALAAVGEWLVSEAVLTAGAIVVGTVVGTVAVISLTAWVVEDAHRKGKLEGLAAWYVSAYSAKVFGLERPSGFIAGDPDDYKLRDQLILLGEKDAVLDARATLTKANNPAAHRSDAEALSAYRALLIAQNQGKWDYAKINLEVALREKSRRLAGL